MEAKATLNEWERARQAAQTTAQQKCEAWHKPYRYGFKINVDAAFFNDELETGLGMVLRDDLGEFVAAQSLRIPGNLDVDVGEAMGFLEALSWAKNLSLNNIIIEGDSKLVVNAMTAPSWNISSFGDIICSCVELAKSFNKCDFSFVKHCANEMAHAIARASRFYESPSLWNEPPIFVVDLPVTACICGG